MPYQPRSNVTFLPCPGKWTALAKEQHLFALSWMELSGAPLADDWLPSHLQVVLFCGFLVSQSIAQDRALTDRACFPETETSEILAQIYGFMTVSLQIGTSNFRYRPIQKIGDSVFQPIEIRTATPMSQIEDQGFGP